MNAASQRAKEACESCRRSHKRCLYDANSTRCHRCERRGTGCSLFSPVEAKATVDQGAPASAESPTEPWDETLYDLAPPQNFAYQAPFQENYYAFLTGTIGEQYPADTITATSLANQHESEQPATTQDAFYGQNVFNDHNGA